MKNKQMTLEELDTMVSDLLFYGVKIDYHVRIAQSIDRKKIVCFLAFKIAGFKMREIAEYFGNTEENIRHLIRKAEGLNSVDKIFHFQVEKVANFINFAK